ncbi:hypothetical protein H2509_00765 [Stappia sp. F7233]|uniref:Uncharacterized protein n=1 Tax=Stappia albiluteola TaxID=2758565 RepID=A0A839A7W1_9HYPH|nr:hypothetical protein [Stappia albiluteola]MBA5775650.1 hypothetical protein [Stappia albiluteola]
MKITRYLTSNILLASSFLFSVPALAQKLNRTGGNAGGSACLCLKAVRESVTTSWGQTQAEIDALKDTHAADMSTCSRSGGVFVGGTTCQTVASLRGPKGPVGDKGPSGADGQISWFSLLSGGGGGGDGGHGVDVNGDGIGDFPSQAQAQAAGYSKGSDVGNCDSCGSFGGSFGGFGGLFGGGGGDGGGGRVVCGELYRQGYLSREIYAANLCHYKLHARPEAARAYHAWAKPYVRLMRRSQLATALIRPLATVWSYQMAYEMGVAVRAPRFGWTITRVLIALHTLVGRYLISPKSTPATASGRPLSGAISLVPSDFFKVS